MIGIVQFSRIVQKHDQNIFLFINVSLVYFSGHRYFYNLVSILNAFLLISYVVTIQMTYLLSKILIFSKSKHFADKALLTLGNQ